MPRMLSRWEKVDALLGWLSIAGVGLVYAAISGPFRGRSGADTYRHHMIQVAVKKVLHRAINPKYKQLTLLAYWKVQSTPAANRIKPHFVSTNRGVKGFRLGDPLAKYIVINFHGGGFAMDATEPYLYFWPNIQTTLANAAPFCEAVETLRYVLEDLKRSPRDVLITGDSAGANLCLAILSHLRHCSVDVPELVIHEPIKGAILISPWVSFSHEWPSVKKNQHKYIDTQEVTTQWSQLYLNGQLSNNYIEAVNAPEEWWNEIQVEQTLVLAGADEVLFDPIKAWTSNFKKSNPDTTLVVGERECHVAPLIWPMFGDFHETELEHALKH
ncbi:Alpha/Beta hydrolase protein [Aspergillus cavernicola]|uniref:Alpha/Beta hydrolase protein n=1 Tax=Aspergillus cavernicola TaxID=176166 RepID=A0ABR4IVD2_9EURO